MSEHSEQVTLFEWAAWKANQGIEPLKWMHAIPNGGHRHKATASKLKAEGYHGLYIEMKINGRLPTTEQVQYLQWLSDVGYMAVMCDGFDEAKEILCDYLGIIE